MQRRAGQIAVRLHAARVFITRLQDWILDHVDEIADVVQSESAKPRVEAALDLLAMVDVVDYIAVNAADFLAAERVEPARC